MGTQSHLSNSDSPAAAAQAAFPSLPGPTSSATYLDLGIWDQDPDTGRTVGDAIVSAGVNVSVVTTTTTAAAAAAVAAPEDIVVFVMVLEGLVISETAALAVAIPVICRPRNASVPRCPGAITFVVLPAR